jgi:hypothetical protein
MICFLRNQGEDMNLAYCWGIERLSFSNSGPEYEFGQSQTLKALKKRHLQDLGSAAHLPHPDAVSA